MIKLRMDRSDAAKATEQQLRDNRKMADSAEDAARTTRKANTAAYSEQQVQAKATAAIIAKANADRVRDAIKAASAEKDAHKSTSGSILEMAAAAGLAEKGFQGVLKVASGIRDAFQEAEKYARGLRGGFTDEREKLAELAAIQGRPSDNAFVAANASFNRATGFRPAEGIAFRSEYANSGAQYAGKNISQAEYEEFERQAGQLAVARGMTPKESGDFAGKVLGMKDFNKYGNQASENALATQNSALEVLKRGSGDNATLVSQFNMAASSMLNEDKLKGLIQDPNELATLISTAAEKSPADAATMLKASGRGLRDFNNPDVKPLLDASGVKPEMGMVESIRRIAPVVEKEAQASGLKVDDVLKKYFHDHLTSEGIGVLINRGVSGGIFKDREDLVAGKIPGMPAISGPGPALDTIAQYQKSERGQLRVAEAATKETELGIGGQDSRLQVLEEQAKRNLLARGEMGTTGAEIVDFISSLTTFGTLDPKRGRLEDEMANIVAGRAKRVGLDAYSYAPAVTRGAMTAEGVNAGFNTALTAVEQAEATAAIKANTQAVQEQNALMRKNAQPVIPPPLAGPPKSVTRNP